MQARAAWTNPTAAHLPPTSVLEYRAGGTPLWLPRSSVCTSRLPPLHTREQPGAWHAGEGGVGGACAKERSCSRRAPSSMCEPLAAARLAAQLTKSAPQPPEQDHRRPGHEHSGPAHGQQLDQPVAADGGDGRHRALPQPGACALSTLGIATGHWPAGHRHTPLEASLSPPPLRAARAPWQPGCARRLRCSASVALPLPCCSCPTWRRSGGCRAWAPSPRCCVSAGLFLLSRSMVFNASVGWRSYVAPGPPRPSGVSSPQPLQTASLP